MSRSPSSSITLLDQFLFRLRLSWCGAVLDTAIYLLIDVDGLVLLVARNCASQNFDFQMSGRGIANDGRDWHSLFVALSSVVLDTRLVIAEQDHGLIGDADEPRIKFAHDLPGCSIAQNARRAVHYFVAHLRLEIDQRNSSSVDKMITELIAAVRLPATRI